MSRKDVPDYYVCLAHEVSRALSFKGGKWPYEYLQEWTGEPEKVCYRAMERAADRGYIDYGVSLRTGWVTEKGKQLLFDQKLDNYCPKIIQFMCATRF